MFPFCIGNHPHSKPHNPLPNIIRTGIPHFSELHFIALHSRCDFDKLKARHFTRKNIILTTHFIAILALLWWAGTKWIIAKV